MGDFARLFDPLFDKSEDDPKSRPSMWLTNRALCWEVVLAPIAIGVSQLKDDDMAWEVWRTALPRQRKAPRLGYPAPKRPPKAEALVTALMHHTNLGRNDAETAVDVASASGQLEAMMLTYGVDPED